ncbi:MAG: SCP2 sterol-binding domain-containing protein [Deltaproteobacteria bacterium]|nr:SCP2 sterol-binding domain-containing protein [Deltaproteobacteria bacterium]
MDRSAFESETVFPAEPVEPRVFVEDVIPSLFVDLELSPEERAAELRVGIVLRGEGGGEWTLHFVEGELGIRSVRAPECDLTIVQRVEDWRSALWEGRPAFVADALELLLQPGAVGIRPGLRPGMAGLASMPDPQTVAELRALRGLLEIRVASEAVGDGDGEGDWCLAVQLGPGALATTPDATIALGAEQAEAIHRGAIHPIEALITGQLRLEGDLGLILQLQALAMRAMIPR